VIVRWLGAFGSQSLLKSGHFRDKSGVTFILESLKVAIPS